MALYQQWQELVQKERTQEAQEAFWQAYFDKETEAYRKILKENTGKLEGTVAELAESFHMTQQEFSGFIDGINTSLSKQEDLEALSSDTALSLTVEFEKLYYNMLAAKAPWLYGLEEWDGVLAAEKRHEITKQFKTDHIFHAESKVGRNDPCPCGSGKKYKKCCGKNL
jgi:hypothetical protein